MSTTDDLIDAVERHTGRAGKRSGKNVRLLCPAHDDHEPSLDVAEAADGSPLVICRSCAAGLPEIAAALGRSMFDYLGSNGGGVEEWTPHGPAVSVYHYVDADGKLLYDVCRTGDKKFSQRRPDPTTKTGWRWNLQGVRRVPYRLPRLRAAVSAGQRIYVVEGEKDVHAIERVEEVATCNSGGAGKWTRAHAEHLRGARDVVIIADRDDPGREHAHAVEESLRGLVETIRIVEAREGKDVSDHIAAGHSLSDLVPLLDERAPFALDLSVFVADRIDGPPALIGTDEDTLLPAHGLLILAGRGGRGKTTLTIDAIFHLASGIEWLGFQVARPLRVLVIENEGPREQFRRKLEQKMTSWPHEIHGAIFVHTLDWGAFAFSDEAKLERLRVFIVDERIDLVVGDPLDTLGIEGVGSPDETRIFVELMKIVGLFQSVAFWLLHHMRKEKSVDALDDISGAWGGRPDTALALELLDGNRSKLHFPKVRWGVGRRPAMLLAFDVAGERYAPIGEDGPERDIHAEVVALLEDGVPRTLTEIGLPVDKGGIGAHRASIESVLEKGQDVFESVTGDAARAIGRRSNATVWRLRSDVGQTSFDDESPNLYGNLYATGTSGGVVQDRGRAPQSEPFLYTGTGSVRTSSVQEQLGREQGSADEGARADTSSSVDVDEDIPF